MATQPALLMANAAEVQESGESWLRHGWSRLEIVDPAQTKIDEKTKPDNYAAACHVGNFDLFFALFSEDLDFQRFATLYPLKYTKYSPNDSYTDEIVEKVRYYMPSEENTGKVAIFPNRHQRQRESLVYTLTGFCGSDCRIALTKDSSDSLLYHYVFHWNGCWFLREVEDHSL
jgi:hypothetical protein